MGFRSWCVFLLIFPLAACVRVDVNPSLKPPTITFSEGDRVNHNTEVTGACTSGLMVRLRLGSKTLTAPCENGSYKIPITFENNEGPHQVIVDYQDKVSDGRSLGHIVYDITPPLLPPAISGWTPGLSRFDKIESFSISTAEKEVASYKYLLIQRPETCKTQLQNLIDQIEIPLNQTSSLEIKSDGTYLLCIILKDLAGNWQISAYESSEFELDKTPPIINVTSHVQQQETPLDFNISGDCEDGSSKVRLSGDLETQETPCESGAFTAALQLSLPDGLKNISIEQSDLAGNQSSLSFQVRLDTTPPHVRITSHGANARMNPYGLVVSGICTFGDKLTIEGTIAESGDVISCLSDGTFSTTVNFTQEGELQTLSVRQVDKVGLSDLDSIPLIADPPVFTITGVRPALAVRGITCALCHASIKGDVITDMGYGEPYSMGQWHNESGATPSLVNPYGLVISGHTWNEKLKLRGSIYVPDQNITQIYVDMLNDPVTGNSYQPSYKFYDLLTKPLKNLQGLAQRVLTFIGSIPSESNPGVSGSVIPKRSLKIGAPTKTQILSLASTMNLLIDEGGVRVYKANNAEFTGFSVVQNGSRFYLRNSTTSKCWGDIVIDGTVFLKNLQLESKAAGCRLHTTQTVFLEGGIQYTNEDTYPKTNIQISSSRAIISGMNPLLVYERFQSHNHAYVPTRNFPTLASTQQNILDVLEDARKVSDLHNHAGPMIKFIKRADINDPGTVLAYRTNQEISMSDVLNSIATDPQWIVLPGKEAEFSTIRGQCFENVQCYVTWAGSLERKSVNYNKVLFNAPIVHNRYYGLFKGIIIADFLLPAVESLEYEFDNTFESVPVLPLIFQDIFKLED